MHELSMCDAIARTVVDRAAGRRVLTVKVRIGHLRQVVPDTMTFCWEMVTAGTELERASWTSSTWSPRSPAMFAAP